MPPTGKVKWKEELATPAFGATTAVNDLVFATTYEGTRQRLRRQKRPGRLARKAAGRHQLRRDGSGNTLIAPAGVAAAEGQTPQIVAFRLADSELEV